MNHFFFSHWFTKRNQVAQILAQRICKLGQEDWSVHTTKLLDQQPNF
jgi:hypothetical protein